jgi:hypothetical protein
MDCMAEGRIDRSFTAVTGRRGIVMTNRIFAASAVLALGFGASNIAIAQAPSWSAEQTAVWKVVEQSWVDDVAQNGKWPGSYVDDHVVSWGPENPSPQYKASMEKWNRFNNSQSKTLQYEISPLAIALSGDTAVVNYTVLQVTQRAMDKPEREVTGIVETLVRSGPGWKFLSTTGFDLKKK